MLVFNPEVIANSNHLLSHLITIATTTWTSQVAIFLALFTAVLPPVFS
jgi:hypothetical protein